MKLLVAVILLIFLCGHEVLAQEDKALEYFTLGYDLQSNGNDEEALSNYLKAYSLYGLNNPKMSAEVLVNIGLIFFNVQSYDKAIEYYQLANKIYDPIKIYTFHNLGTSFSRQGKYNEALDYFEKNLALARDRDDQYQISKTYIEMGIVSYEAEDYEGARSYAERVKSRAENDSQQPKLYAAALNNIANSYYADKNYPLAKSKLLECLDVFTTRNIPYYRGHALNNLAGTYKGLGNTDSSLYYFAQALEVNQTVNDLDETQISLSELADIHESMGEKDSALYYTRRLVELYKSNSYRQIEFDKKAVGLKLETIQARHLLEEEKGKGDYWIWTSVVIGIATAAVILAFMGYLWRRSRNKSSQ